MKNNRMSFKEIIFHVKKLECEVHIYILTKIGKIYRATEISQIDYDKYLNYALFQTIEMVDIFGKSTMQIILVE